MESPQIISAGNSKSEVDPAELLKKLELQLAALRPARREETSRTGMRVAGLVFIGLMLAAVWWVTEWMAAQMKAEHTRPAGIEVVAK